MRVLIIEDDPATALAVSNAARRFGYEVAAAANTAAAWRLLYGEVFPIVVTDWSMPGGDGLELCQRIRQTPFEHYTYVIFLTDRKDPGSFVRALEAGADDFATKPFDPVELKMRLMVGERIVNLERELRETNISLRKANADLELLSRVDALTNIGNRLSFEENIARLHGEAQRHGSHYGVVMCDIDHFKQVNDTLGHLAGDQILRETAAAVQAGIRRTDLAFRYGGEEIVLLVRDLDLDGLRQIAERARRNVERQSLRLGHLGESVRVTISCGVASFPCSVNPDDPWTVVVEQADRAMYQAKRAGRNRVETAGTPSAVSLDPLVKTPGIAH